MVKVTVFLKSGQTVNFTCESCTFSYDNLSLEFVGYQFEGIKEFKKASFVPSQIAGYTTKLIQK